LAAHAASRALPITALALPNWNLVIATRTPDPFRAALGPRGFRQAEAATLDA
jgi:hypothetical protein